MFVFLAVFALIWHLLLLGLYRHLLSGFQPPDSPQAWLGLAFALVPLLVPWAMSYTVLAGFLNTTTLTLEPERLRIQHGPLPWRGGRVLQRSEVAQFYCKKHLRRSEHGLHRSFALWMRDQQGRDHLLLKNFWKAEQPLWLEEQLEAYWDLPHRQIDGAYQLPRQRRAQPL